MIDFAPFISTLKLAVITTLVLLAVTFPVAVWVTRTHSRWGYLVESIMNMPLVLPPSVLGFYLLIALGPHGIIGWGVEHLFDFRLAFTFPGLVIGSAVFSLPFMAGALISGLRAVPVQLTEAGRTLGKTEWTIFRRIILPSMRSSVLSGVVLTFAHTVGEFGVVLMLGGNLPGDTRMASIAVYEAVEQLDYTTAHIYSIILFLLSFVIISVVSRRHTLRIAGVRHG